MSTTAPSYPDWKAPAEDGKVLIWPQPDQLLEQTRENNRRLGAVALRVQNVPLNEVRSRARQYVGHADDAQPLLATGHQTELYHPGVWVKDVLIDAAAKKMGGQAYHLAVDTDAPKHLMLRWPGGAMPITDDPGATSAAWSDLLAPPTPKHLNDLSAEISEASKSWSFQPIVHQFLLSLRRLLLQSTNLSSALTNALHELDWSLGLRHHALTVSPIWSSEPFLLFVHHVISRAGRFAADYNAALGEFRRAHRMQTSTRPMPDLFASPESIEAPFWLDDLSSGKRSRPSVFRAGDMWVLQLLGGEEFAFDPRADGWDAATKLARWLASNAHRIAPRALTLTLFFRLFFADQFVHGIGGGRYDQVTDSLIDRHFGIEPPNFAVTTATMFFPDALGRERVCVPCVLHEGHRLHHAVLGPRKLELVRQIESLPRRSHDRALAFAEMHEEIDHATKSHPEIKRWRRRLEETQERQKDEQILFDRELFYAIQSQARLEQMISRYRAEFSAP